MSNAGHLTRLFNADEKERSKANNLEMGTRKRNLGDVEPSSSIIVLMFLLVSRLHNIHDILTMNQVRHIMVC